MSKDEEDRSGHPGRLFACPVKLVLQKGHEGLDDGDGGCHAGDKEEGKPERPEELSQGDFLKNKGHGLESKVKGPALGDGGCSRDAKKGHGHGDGNGSAQDHLGKFIGHGGGQAVEGDIIIFP